MKSFIIAVAFCLYFSSIAFCEDVKICFTQEELARYTDSVQQTYSEYIEKVFRNNGKQSREEVFEMFKDSIGKALKEKQEKQYETD